MPPPPLPKRPGKIPLEKGYSQMDWMRLQQTSKDLAGLSSMHTSLTSTRVQTQYAMIVDYRHTALAKENSDGGWEVGQCASTLQ